MEALAGQFPDDSELLAQLATLLHQAGKADEARAAVERYLEGAGNLEFAWMRGARLLESFGQTDAAEQTWTRLVERFPESVGAKEAQAAFLHGAGKVDEALVIWRKIATNGSAQDALRVARAMASRRENAAALEILETRAEEFRNDSLYLQGLIQQAIAVDRNADALGWMETRLALVETPDQLTDVLSQAMQLIAGLDDPEAYREQLRAKPDRKPAESCLLAEMLDRNAEFAAAEATLDAVQGPQEVLALSQKARLLQLRDEFHKAAETVEKLLAQPKGRTTSQIQRLVKLHVRALDSEKALRRIEEWKQLTPGSVSPWLEQAAILTDDDRTKEAIAVLKQAARVHDGDERILTRLAQLHQREKQFAEAETIYRRFFNTEEALDAKLRWIAPLAEVAKERGRIGELIAEFKERRKTNATSLLPLLALAEIHEVNVDSKAQREILNAAMRLRPEDVRLRHRLARLHEMDGQWEEAVRLLEEVVPGDSGGKTRQQIALLHLRYGDQEVGYQKLVEGFGQLTADEIERIADAMMARQNWDLALRLLDEQRAAFPDDWRLAYQHGVVLEEEGQLDRAADAFLEALGASEDLPRLTAGFLRGNRALSYFQQMAETMEKNRRFLPPETEPFLGLNLANYFGYDYWQKMRGNASGRFYASTFLGAGFLRLPNSPLDARHYARAHLRGIAQNWDEPEKRAFAPRMEAVGQRHAAILLALPFSRQYFDRSLEFPAGLLEAYPNHAGLHAYCVLWHQQKLQSNGTWADISMLRRCFERLREKFPNLALAAGCLAASLDEEDGAALLETALAELTLQDEPGDYALNAVTTALGALHSGNQRRALKPEHRKKLTALLVKWREDSWAKMLAEKGKLDLDTRFGAMDQVLLALRHPDSTAQFVQRLRDEVREYRRLTEETGKRARGIVASAPWVNSRRELLAALPFPPVSGLDFPPNVLRQFTNLNISPRPAALPEDTFDVVLPNVEDPVLKLLMLVHEGEKEQASALMEQMVSAPEADLEILQLGAALFGQLGNRSRAVELLELCQDRSMGKERRRQLDGAMVHYATQIKEPAPETKQLAQNALRRLRYGSLIGLKAPKLITAMKALDMDEEAERLEKREAKLAALRGSRSGTGSSVAQDLDDRMRALLRKDKDQEAVEQTLRAIRPYLLSMSRMVHNSVDYNTVNTIRAFKYEKKLDQLLEAVKPGKNPAPADLAVHGAMLELCGKSDEAAAAYRAALDSKPMPALSLRLAVLEAVAGAENPEAFARLSRAQQQQVGMALNNALRIVDYMADDTVEFHARANVAKAVATWLQTAELPPHQDQTWVVNSVLRPLAWELRGGGNHLLTPLQHRPNSQQILRYSGYKHAPELTEERDRAILRLSGAMIAQPGLARSGFRYLAAVAEVTALADAPDAEEMAERAREAIRQHGKHRGLWQNSTSNYQDSERYAIARWPEEYLIRHLARQGAKPGDEQVAEIIAETRRWRNREIVRSIEAYRDLWMGAEADFAEAATRFLSTNPSRFFSGNPRYAPASRISRPDNVFEAWSERGLSRETLAAVVERECKRLGRTGGMVPTFVDDAIRHELREGRLPEAHALLETAATAWLGERENWEKFVRPREKRTSSSGRVYFNQRDWTNPKHAVFANFLRRCMWEPELVLPVLEFVLAHELNDGDQVSESILLDRLANGPVHKDAKLLFAMIQRSAILRDPPEFRPLRLEEDEEMTALEAVAHGVKSAPDEVKREVLDAVAKLEPTLGQRLFLAHARGSDQLTAVREAMADAEAKLKTAPEAHAVELALYLHRTVPSLTESATKESPVGEVMKEMRKAEAETVENEIDAVLKAKNTDDFGITSEYALERKIGALLDPLWRAGDFDKAAQIYWHCVELVAKRQAAGNWQHHRSGWGFPGDFLHDILDDTPGGGLERVIFYHRIINADKAGRVAVSSSGFRTAAHMRAAFEAAGGPENVEKAAAALAVRLTGEIGPGDRSLLGFAFASLRHRLSPAQLRRYLAWADANRQGQPWSPLAVEIGHALRYRIATDTGAKFAALRGQIPDPDVWVAHYTAKLRDDSLPYPRRTDLGNLVSLASPQKHSELILASAETLAESLQADAQLNSWHVMYVLRGYNRLQTTDRWREIAEKLDRGWLHKNRNNHKDRATGLAFYPMGVVVRTMLDFYLKFGDEAKLNAFRADDHMRGEFTPWAGSILAHVEHGDYPGALTILRDGARNVDVWNDYPARRNTHDPRYSLAAHEKLPEFLATIQDPAEALFAHILVAGAADPLPEDVPRPLPFAPRWNRVTGKWREFEQIQFTGEQTAIRKRLLDQFSRFPGPAWNLRRHYAALWKPEEVAEIPKIGEQPFVGYSMRLPSAHAMNQLRQGDFQPAKAIVSALNRDDYWAQQALEELGTFLHTYPLRRYLDYAPKEPDAMAEACLFFLANAHENRLPDNLNEVGLAFLISTARANGRDELLRRFADLPENRRAKVREHFRTKKPKVWGALTQVTRAGGEKPAPLPMRAALLEHFFANPEFQAGYGAQLDAFKFALEKKLLTEEALRGELGEKLAKIWPRHGYAAVELAALHQAAGDAEAARKWAQKALESAEKAPKSVAAGVKRSLKEKQLIGDD